MIGSTLLLAAVFATAGQPTPVVDSQDLEANVSDEARLYRITVYSQFRTDRDQFDQRQEAGEKVFDQWKKSDRGVVASAEAVRWFVNARQQLDPQGRALVGMVPVENDELIVLNTVRAARTQTTNVDDSSTPFATTSVTAEVSDSQDKSPIAVSAPFPTRVQRPAHQATEGPDRQIDLVRQPVTRRADPGTSNPQVVDTEPSLAAAQELPRAEVDDKVWDGPEPSTPSLEADSLDDQTGLLKGSALHILSRAARAIILSGGLK